MSDINPTFAPKKFSHQEKPSGWARRSCAPYYKKFYGEQMKAEANKMLENRQDLVYPYRIWCTAATGMSHATLYNRINQSIRYLIDHLDENQKFSDWHAMVRIERIKDQGVRISFIPEFRNSSISEFKGILAESRDATPKWKMDMMYWLEEQPEVAVFNAEKLCLSDSEVSEVKTFLSGLDSIGKSIKHDSIKLVRL